MKTSLLLIVGIIFSGGFIITDAYGACGASLTDFNGPCFDAFMGFTDQDVSKKTIMENLHKHMESRHGELKIPDRMWDSYETPIQLPAILCTEFAVDGMKQYRMAQWADYFTISSWKIITIHYFVPNGLHQLMMELK